MRPTSVEEVSEFIRYTVELVQAHIEISNYIITIPDELR